jgi:hypothetical protein
MATARDSAPSCSRCDDGEGGTVDAEGRLLLRQRRLLLIRGLRLVPRRHRRSLASDLSGLWRGQKADGIRSVGDVKSRTERSGR